MLVGKGKVYRAPIFYFSIDINLKHGTELVVIHEINGTYLG